MSLVIPAQCAKPPFARFLDIKACGYLYRDTLIWMLRWGLVRSSGYICYRMAGTIFRNRFPPRYHKHSLKTLARSLPALP
ncbi:hypothetical protein [Coxiella burnetii]|uniref:hypothetical protein n=1 Tax=Coxiella burnetii TaxID=777 RepID=UPI000589F829|nr:hypothetical protein [Coxiella burnetii]